MTNRDARPEDVLRGQLTSMVPQFAAALPSHIKPEKFQRVVMTVVQQQPDLMLADRRTLLASCLKCASDGLIPDGREAALVIFNTKNKDGSWTKAVQYMPMMAGILKRIRNAGEIASVQAHVIHEHDKFVIRRGINETIEHEPLFPGDRGQPIGAYAVAKFKDGSDPVFEVMDINAINRVRNVSRAKDKGPWVDWWDEMARKTVFRRMAKWLPMDADVDAVIRRDDEAGNPTIETTAVPIEELPAIEHGASKLDAIEAGIDAEAEPVPAGERVEMEWENG